MRAGFLAVLYYLAMSGFLLSAGIHVVTFFGINPSEKLSDFWMLHFGVFVLLLPAVFFFKGREIYQIVNAAPSWMRKACAVFMIYSIANFFLIMKLSESATPDIVDGKYVLSNHGSVVRELSKDEYDKQLRYIPRLFTGHWIIAYFALATVFVAVRREHNAEKDLIKASQEPKGTFT